MVVFENFRRTGLSHFRISAILSRGIWAHDDVQFVFWDNSLGDADVCIGVVQIGVTWFYPGHLEFLTAGCLTLGRLVFEDFLLRYLSQGQIHHGQNEGSSKYSGSVWIPNNEVVEQEH